MKNFFQEIASKYERTKRVKQTREEIVHTEIENQLKTQIKRLKQEYKKSGEYTSDSLHAFSSMGPAPTLTYKILKFTPEQQEKRDAIQSKLDETQELLMFHRINKPLNLASDFINSTVRVSKIK